MINVSNYSYNDYHLMITRHCVTLNHAYDMPNLLDLFELLECLGTSLGCVAHPTLWFSFTGFETKGARE